MHSIDLIITTYNRPKKLGSLLNQLLSIEGREGDIIIVDSSDIPVHEIIGGERIKYIHSNHKNQPYQRYLGFRSSSAEILIFLDDDMEVLDFNFISKINSLFKDSTLAGVAIRFDNKYAQTSLSNLPRSKLVVANKYIAILKGWITGYPVLTAGKFDLCGNRGKQPMGGGQTQWLSGGAFAARRLKIFQNFNFQLFDIYEMKLGKAEDGIIGYGLSKVGQLNYHDELFLMHDDQNDSTYTEDIIAFSKRVAFSRLFLSLERTRLNHGSIFFARIHYHYYMCWRLAGLLINYIISPSVTRYRILKGALSGWVLTLGFKFLRHNERFQYWDSEVTRELSVIETNAVKEWW